MDDPIYETPINQYENPGMEMVDTRSEYLDYKRPTNQYKLLGKRDMEMAKAESENKNEIRKLKRQGNILIVLFLLSLCVAVVALALVALSVTKDGDETIRQKNDTCSSGPCANQGTCTNVYPDDYVCSCVATYYGRNCEHALKDASFFATYKVWNTSVPSGAVVTWDDVRYDPGNNYNSTTGAYTAPSDGYYQFSVAKRTEGSWSSLSIQVDGTNHWLCWTHRSSGFPDAQTRCTIDTQLHAGQKVQVFQQLGTNVKTLQNDHYINSWFTGQMLYPTF